MCQIIIAHYNENLLWTNKLTYPYIIYSRTISDNAIFIPHNIGREAYVYANYIVDNYNNIPEKCLFLHGHENSWHQSDTTLKLIEKLDWSLNYFNINNNKIKFNLQQTGSRIENGFKLDKNYIRTDNWWNFIFHPHLDFPTEPIYSTGSAQFLVDRRLIYQYPKSVYQNMMDWLLTTDIDKKHWLNDNRYPYVESYISARLFEFTWEYIFTSKVHKNGHSTSAHFN